MNITIRCSDKFPVDWESFREFVQAQANRLAFGRARYGVPASDRRYHKRGGLERSAYRRTGNREHLLNIANYAWLESFAPENKKFHWDNSVDSVTREELR